MWEDKWLRDALISSSRLFILILCKQDDVWSFNLSLCAGIMLINLF